MTTEEYVEKLVQNHLELDLENYRNNKKEELLKVL